MTMYIPFGQTSALDTCDLVMIVPRAASRCTVFLTNGKSLTWNQAASDVVDEANNAAGILPDSLFFGPIQTAQFADPIYVAGAHVKNVSPSGLGITLAFGNVGTVLTITPETAAALVTLINATVGCGGGGGGGGATTGIWTPTVTDAAGFAAVNQQLTGFYIRNGNTVQARFAFDYSWISDGVPTIRFDVPNDGTNLLSLSAADAYCPSYWTYVSLLPVYVDADNLGVDWATPIASGNAGLITVDLIYTTDAP